MADILDKFILDCKDAYGENLQSIILYGSKASGEDVGKKSDYNILLILKKLDFDHLKSLNYFIPKWLKDGNPPPLLFTMQRFKKSADVFPIEFIDIKDNHKVLYGDDPFSNLEIHDNHLRHQCEFELKGKLLKLRQGYMIAHKSEKEIKDLMISSLSSVLVVFRHVIRLFGKIPPVKKFDALNILKELTNIDTTVFENIMKMKQGDKQTLKLDPDTIMRQYLEQIEKVVDIVDHL